MAFNSFSDNFLSAIFPVDHFLRLFPSFTEGHVLDLGCGPADIPTRLCRALPGVRVTGVDGAKTMVLSARRAVEEAGLADRISIVEGLVTPRLSVPPVDAVISNSLLHHLHEPLSLWTTIANTAKPGAPVLVIDLVRPASQAEASLLEEKYVAAEAPVLRRDFYNSLLAALSVDEVSKDLEVSGLLGALSVSLISDRHMMIAGKVPDFGRNERC